MFLCENSRLIKENAFKKSWAVHPPLNTLASREGDLSFSLIFREIHDFDFCSESRIKGGRPIFLPLPLRERVGVRGKKLIVPKK